MGNDADVTAQTKPLQDENANVPKPSKKGGTDRPHYQEEEPNVFSQVGYAIAVVIAFVVVICLIPFLIPIILVFGLYRHVLINAIKKKHGEHVFIASGNDNVWLQDSKKNKAIINTLFFVKGPLNIETIRKVFTEKMINHPDKSYAKLRMYTTQLYHRYIWVEEDNFNIDEHIFCHTENAPEHRSDLEKMIGELSSGELPKKKAPWQFVIIPANNKDPNLFYILIRFHHSMADGISLVRCIINVLTNSPIEELTHKRTFGSSGHLKRILQGIILGPLLIFSRFLWPTDHHALHGPELCGEKMVSWSKPMSLERIKRMKNKAGTTVNDVLMSCVSSTLREYLKRHSSQLPKNISVYVPVDLRSDSKVSIDNQFALVFVSLPLDEDDPIDMMLKTKHRMDSIKHSPEPLMNTFIIRFAMARLPNWATQLLFDWFSSKCSMILSNVPGPKEALHVDDMKIEDVVFWPPQRANVGIGVSILSYGEHVTIGIMTDKAILTNPQVLVKLYEEKVKDLATELEIEWE